MKSVYLTVTTLLAVNSAVAFEVAKPVWNKTPACVGKTVDKSLRGDFVDYATAERGSARLTETVYALRDNQPAVLSLNTAWTCTVGSVQILVIKELEGVLHRSIPYAISEASADKDELAPATVVYWDDLSAATLKEENLAKALDVLIRKPARTVYRTARVL